MHFIIRISGRDYLVSKNNFPKLIELVKIFNGTVYSVNLIKGKPLTVKDFVHAVCDKDFNGNYVYEIVSQVYPVPVKRGRKMRNNLLDEIKIYCLANRVVSLSKMRSEIHCLKNIDSQTLYRYVDRSIRDLKRIGYCVRRLRRGHYLVEN